jgi:murein DD-endopeptidase MepM/ murein hydrolase activator NlpD
VDRAPVLGGVVGLMLVPLGFRAYPSYRPASAVQFRVPMDGPVTVGWGGGTADVNYHVVSPDQRWAYDLLVTRDGSTHRGDGTRLEDYYCYDLPVLAPADGTVLQVVDRDPDMPPGQLGGGTDPGGNYIVLQVAEGEYLFLCHLKPGSITVKTGDRVTRGQPIARVGNSGNTSEPHLHIHLQDSPESGWGEGIPMPFHRYRTAERLIESAIPTGGFKNGKLIGQVIEHAGDR